VDIGENLAFQNIRAVADADEFHHTAVGLVMQPLRHHQTARCHGLPGKIPHGAQWTICLPSDFRKQFDRMCGG